MGNQNSSLMKHQIDNTTPGEWGLTRGDWSQALTREVNSRNHLTFQHRRSENQGVHSSL